MAMDPPLPMEQWRPIPDAPGYEISNRGRVRSFWVHAGAHATISETSHPIKLRPNQRNVQLRKTHYNLDALMAQVWSRFTATTDPPPKTWRRVMITTKQHTALMDILRASSHPRAEGLLLSVRHARIVLWDDPIEAEEMDESCEG